MAKHYDYSFHVWLRLAVSRTPPEFQEQLREYLDLKYQVLRLDLVEDSEADMDGEVTVSLQFQVTFNESEMEGDESTEAAIARFDRELRGFLECKYEVSYLDVIDDSPTSHLIAEWEEPAARKYPEPKHRDLTDEEKSQLRGRIDRGDADIYALAAEFGCSASQIAGIKAAMHR